MMTGEFEKPRLNVVEKPRRQRLRVLLADSDREAAFALCRAADTSVPICLKYAPDNRAAAALLEEEEWDLIALDPDDAADFHFLQRIKASHRWTATVALTRSLTPQLMNCAMTRQIDEILLKPVSPSEFLGKVLYLAGKASERRRREQERVLAIGAHPDDVEIGCGGALAKHHARGGLLRILTLSRGAAGGDTNVRTLEAQRAAQALGASLTFANLPDRHISDGVETISLIEKAIDELVPTHVYTHSFEDTHQDHRAAHRASIVAARGVPNVYCYQSPSSMVTFRPHRYVDITDFLKVKLQAIAAYKSQAERIRDLHPDYVISEARHWGRYAGYILAEGFQIERQVDRDETRTIRDLQFAADEVADSLPEPPPWNARSAAAS
jgi:LmbE family N-acetylglucosaminyl deacetylase